MDTSPVTRLLRQLREYEDRGLKLQAQETADELRDYLRFHRGLPPNEAERVIAGDLDSDDEAT